MSECIFDASAPRIAHGALLGRRGRDATTAEVHALDDAHRAVGRTGRDIRQQAVADVVAQSRSDRPEPVELRLHGVGDAAADAKVGGAGALDRGVVEVGLDAEDDLAELVVVADLATGSPALGFGVAQPAVRDLSELTEAIAGVDASIKTSPAEGRLVVVHDHRLMVIADSRPPKVGGLSERGSRDAATDGECKTNRTSKKVLRGNPQVVARRMSNTMW